MLAVDIIQCHYSVQVTSSHVESVYSRRCISYILRSTLGVFLSESQQIVAVQELCKIVIRQMSLLGKLTITRGDCLCY